MQPSLQKIFQTLLNYVYPNDCLLCQLPSDSDLLICHACQQHLPWLGPSCFQCASPLTAALSTTTPENTLVCGQCLKEKPRYDHTLSPWYYQPPIDKYISQLKFNHQLHFAKLLGGLFAEFLENHLTPATHPQCLIPMPLHNQRLRRRGFNQALEIAKPIAARLKIPIQLDIGTRVKNTKPQTELGAAARRQNLRKAFRVNKSKFTHVAIIDDVMTTGATVNTLSHSLKRTGVNQIEVWCCARAQMQLD